MSTGGLALELPFGPQIRRRRPRKASIPSRTSGNC